MEKKNQKSIQPTKPVSPFFLYMKNVQNDFKNQYPQYSQTEITSLINQSWKKISSKEFEQYQKQFISMTQQYEKDLVEWKRTNNQQANSQGMRQQKEQNMSQDTKGIKMPKIISSHKSSDQQNKTQIQKQDNSYQIIKMRSTQMNDSNDLTHINQQQKANKMINMNIKQESQNQFILDKYQASYDSDINELLQDIAYDKIFKHEDLADFQSIRFNEQSFIDRSLLINLIINEKYLLITHPRRSGKSTCLDMLKDFFEKQVDEYGQNDLQQQTNKKSLFFGGQFKNSKGFEYQIKGLLIVEHQVAVENEFGTRPVIFMNFNSLDQLNNEQDLNIKLMLIISQQYQKHQYLLNNLSESDKITFKQFLTRDYSSILIDFALLFLCTCLYNHYKIGVVIIVDEYDYHFNRIIQNQDINYKLLLNLTKQITQLLSCVGKDNKDVSHFIICGNFDTLVKSGSSGLNNISKFGMDSVEIEDYFGLTKELVQEKLDSLLDVKQLNLQKKKEVLINIISNLYNGYQGYKSKLYNIWSVYQFLKKITHNAKNNLAFPLPANCMFWIETKQNNLFSRLLSECDQEVQTKMIQLSLGKQIKLEYDEKPTCEQQEQYVSYVLFNSGYITKVKQNDSIFQIPNGEVLSYFKNLLAQYSQPLIKSQELQNLRIAILSRKQVDIEKALISILNQFLSLRNVAKIKDEQHYHMLLIGLLQCMNTTHRLLSEQEAGEGYADLILIPILRMFKEYAYIFELKYQKLDNQSSNFEQQLQQKAKDAIKQIQDKKYVQFAEKWNLKKCIFIGIAFSGKSVAVQVQE